MPLFCSKCRNLMIVDTSAIKCRFKCEKCKLYEELTPEDTLRYEDTSDTSILMYRALLTTASGDPLNPMVKKLCLCGHKYARQLRIGDEMKLIISCIGCGKQSLEADNVDFIESEMQK